MTSCRGSAVTLRGPSLLLKTPRPGVRGTLSHILSEHLLVPCLKCESWETPQAVVTVLKSDDDGSQEPFPMPPPSGNLPYFLFPLLSRACTVGEEETLVYPSGFFQLV